MFTPEQKIEHLKHLKDVDFNEDTTEILKMYQGESFDHSDPMYKKLLEYSYSICGEFTDLSRLLEAKTSVAQKAMARKQEILDILFPGHGPIFGGGDDLNAVIGLVDLDGFNYINSRVDFGKTSLVHLGEYVFVANDVTFGDVENKADRMAHIDVKPDTWICAGVGLQDGAKVGGKSVITLGSVVDSGIVLPDRHIITGSPAIARHEILAGFKSGKEKLEIVRPEEDIREILKHIRKQGIEGDYTEYTKLLRNKEYNTLDPTIGRIFDFSHHLVSEYNYPNTTQRRREEILDILFFMHGDGFKVGKNLLCDVMGTVNIGRGVHIGDGVNLAGNIEVGNNVDIENRVLLQGLGHRMLASERRLCQDKRGHICEWTVPSFIKIASGVTLKNGTKVASGLVDKDTEPGEIIR